VYRIAQRQHQHGRGQHDQHDADQHQRGRRKPLSAPHAARQLLLGWIEIHRQDQGPRHQTDEGRKDLVAQQHHREHEPGADEDIHESARQAGFEVGFRRVGRIHGLDPLP
jgi:hypothetical protein